MRNRYLLLLAGLLAGFSARAQTLAPTLLDDFNRADSPTVGAGWVETETTPGTGVSIVNNQLKLNPSQSGLRLEEVEIKGE